jgi:hypothetical protein
MVKDLVSVDNAPIDARLESDFARYCQGMRKVDEADVTKLGEADKILEDYEKVSRDSHIHLIPSEGGPLAISVTQSVVNSDCRSLPSFVLFFLAT